MNVLVTGGSGIVGTIVLPTLLQEHRATVFDLLPPRDPGIPHLAGSVTDHLALRRAVNGMDALIYMAMGALQWAEWAGSESAFDVNVKGVHLALRAAAEAGITQAVYCSTMSVYADLARRRFPDEDVAPDETNVYGFTKWLGEEVCKNACRRWAINVNVLRLCLPLPEKEWREKARTADPLIATAAEDVGRAMLAALRLQAGFQVFTINGDHDQKQMNLSKAKRLLGWEPLSRPNEQPMEA